MFECPRCRQDNLWSDYQDNRHNSTEGCVTALGQSVRRIEDLLRDHDKN